jgi:hypothetical protein
VTAPEPRPYGPGWWTAIDLLRSAWRTRSLTALAVVLAILLAGLVALVVKVVLPFAVYPAL